MTTSFNDVLIASVVTGFTATRHDCCTVTLANPDVATVITITLNDDNTVQHAHKNTNGDTCGVGFRFLDDGTTVGSAGDPNETIVAWMREAKDYYAATLRPEFDGGA